MQSLAIAGTYRIWGLRELVFYYFRIFKSRQKDKHIFGEAVTTETTAAVLYLFL